MYHANSGFGFDTVIDVMAGDRIVAPGQHP